MFEEGGEFWEALKKGENFGKLKRVFVIFICSYDPFDRGRMLYTIRNMCVEVPELEYDDGVRTVFLNTKGADEDVSEELMELLRFMEDTREVNAVNDVLREMQEMVDIVKADGKVTVAYMKSFEIEQMWIKQGIDQGIKQGINQGIKQGIEQGRKEERVNTLREKERADCLERELREIRREIRREMKKS